MIDAAAGRSWSALAWAHARWILRTTWRNGEQLLLVVAIPIIAFIALSRTDIVSSSIPPLVTATTMVVLGSGFTSPAITLAFERRYGAFAFLGTTPLPRSALIAGTATAIAVSALIAGAILVLLEYLSSGLSGQSVSQGSTPLALLLSVLLGLTAVVPWAFVLGGTARSETVLVIANAIFVVAVLFGGVLVGDYTEPYATIVAWLPPGAIVDFAVAPTTPGALALLAWGAAGTALAVRVFRWR